MDGKFRENKNAPTSQEFFMNINTKKTEASDTHKCNGKTSINTSTVI
jgi:hypothetical protein